MTGAGFDTIKEMDQEARDRVGEIIFRFFFGCMYRHRQFSGDPHPGNFLLQPDGKVAFLDFGLFKVMPEELIKIELECQRAGHEGDGERLKQIWTETGFLAQPDRFRPDKLLAQFLDATWWYVLDEEIELQPEVATQVMIEMSDPRSSHFGQMRHETLPADHLFGRRVEMLTLAVLSQLRARGNFHRIAREWMYDDEPVTELGRGRDPHSDPTPTATAEPTETPRPGAGRDRDRDAGAHADARPPPRRTPRRRPAILGADGEGPDPDLAARRAPRRSPAWRPARRRGTSAPARPTSRAPRRAATRRSSAATWRPPSRSSPRWGR